jgi:NTE family protein
MFSLRKRLRKRKSAEKLHIYTELTTVKVTRSTVILTAFICALSYVGLGQRVGVVLSGGGAKAAAHVGVLKALEENGVPIDYISGSSMGAIVGGMYASGYTIHEIDSILRSDEYLRMTRGEVDDALRFYFKEYDADASMGTLKFSTGEFITPILPTNLVSTALLDFNFMEGFSQASAASEYNFDELMIPFRTVAADIANKRQVIFRNGHLSTAIRASMTYPFYVKPIEVDGNLLFDGGLYNNFPSDILYEDFLPDVILGSNVSSNGQPPREDDPISQLKSMVTYETNFELLCDQMLIVEPDLDLGTFDFERVGEAIDAGYAAAIARMPEILEIIERRVDKSEVDAKRAAFRSKFTPIVFDEITIDGLERSQRAYIRRFIGRKVDTLAIGDFERQFYRVYSDDKIRSIFPTATYKPETGFYRVNMRVRKETDIFLSAGGNFSSRPLNMGYVNLRYNLFGRISSTLNANSYFGKFYGSAHVSARVDFPGRLPFSIEPFVTLNRWDYFRSFATFFEEVRPSFIVINERYTGLRFRFPVNNKGRLDVIGNVARINDDYYQMESFTAVDTADRTRMYAGIADVIYERSTLNRKMYANSGTFLRFQAKYTYGEEQTIPGSTSLVRDTTRTLRRWVMVKANYTNYFTKFGPFRLGFALEGVASTQPLLNNMTASQISAQAFQPIPEARSFFLPQFRAYNYAAGGLMLVTQFTPNLDLRVEGHAFVASGRIRAFRDGVPTFDYELQPYYIGSTALVFHSPLGPLSLSLNYYDGKERPWSFLFNFGYFIFNRSVRHN